MTEGTLSGHPEEVQVAPPRDELLPNRATRRKMKEPQKKRYVMAKAKALALDLHKRTGCTSQEALDQLSMVMPAIWAEAEAKYGL